MEDFDIFTDEIMFSKPLYKNILNKFAWEMPEHPSGPNYQSSRKLLAEACLADNDESGCAFFMSEAVSACLRTMAVYRDEQTQIAEDKKYKITSFIKPVQDVIDSSPISKTEEKLLDSLTKGCEDAIDSLKKLNVNEEIPFYKKYIQFSAENNVENFQKILKELPKEWTIVQLTVPYNPKENFSSVAEYQRDVTSLYVSLFTNDYFDEQVGPLTIHLPANLIKLGEKPLFTELYSILEENYKTIDNAQFLNNKRLVQNYWNRREDIDLRIKSVINVMDKEWLGGFGSLLTGKLIEPEWKKKIIKHVDETISDWGFIRLTPKQKFLLYNLIESCSNMSSHQIKSCIRRILTEQGNKDDIKQILDTTECGCSKDFTFLSELCLKCLSKSFEKLHHFSLVDGIKAFSKAAALVKDGDQWAGLKKAKRHPVILIVDDLLDTFPWETLPILNQHPVSRIESIHFLYYLYKVHEKNIVEGYLDGSTDVGRYVINPEKNLPRMEKRMTSFVTYWCGDWRGHVAEPPPPDQYLHALTHSDVFLYCGHGAGCQYAAPGARPPAARGAALLSGCGSARTHTRPRAAPAAPHRALRLAATPLVIGMLWEVTDLEVDKVVSTLLSLYVPSNAPVPWPSVGKAKWSQGILDTEVEQKSQFTPEPDLLRAISRARGSSNFVMIASSVVARGLPIRVAK